MIIIEDGVMWQLQKHELIEYLEKKIAIANDDEDFCLYDFPNIGEVIPEPIATFDYYDDTDRLKKILAKVKKTDDQLI